MTEGWGEQREAARASRRRGRAKRIVGALVVAIIGVPFLQGVIDGATGRTGQTGPHGLLAWATWIGFALVLATIGVRGWRDADEVQRRRTTEWLAVIGLVSLVLEPALAFVAVALHDRELIGLAWPIAVCAGAAFVLARRMRENG